LIVVCSLPGAGKTTFARELADRVCAIRLSADEWAAILGYGKEEMLGRLGFDWISLRSARAKELVNELKRCNGSWLRTYSPAV
jgi:tRNA uridine 5-carbamoylmethylation protein Kti12